MIVYQSTKAEFLDNTFSRDIEKVILDAYRRRVGRGVSQSEVRSWKESLLAMAKVLNHDSIPSDCGVAIEYWIPQTSKRIDLLLTGNDGDDRDNLLIVELKQWEAAAKTNKDGIVRTRFAGGEADTSHPSYQAWSYAELLRNFNEAVDTESVPLRPCAYLHNCVSGDDLNDPFYADYVREAPLFLAGDKERDRLRAFIAMHVRRGDHGRLIVRIENGRIRPSKRLVDALTGMLAGKREFVLIDEQKVVYETSLALALGAAPDKKQVVIIDGGPGTGKSVVAINLMVALTGKDRLTKYVTKNRAPREVFEKTLSGSYRRSRISSLFAGSGEFTARQLGALFKADRERIQALGRRAGSALQVHDALQARPLRNVSGLQRLTRRSPPTLLKALDVLEKLGIVREVTGRRRNRVFEYRRYMELLNRDV